MAEAIEYEQFDQSAQPGGASQADLDLSRLSDIPMELSVEIGRTHMTVGETLDLRVGSVVNLVGWEKSSVRTLAAAASSCCSLAAAATLDQPSSATAAGSP